MQELENYTMMLTTSSFMAIFFVSLGVFTEFVVFFLICRRRRALFVLIASIFHFKLVFGTLGVPTTLWALMANSQKFHFCLPKNPLSIFCIMNFF